MSLLTWVAPPVLGAIIGFVTNDIAIRMLFRPLKEYRFLGLRVPFTPGIIPRRRHELAQAIGRMVSEELVTAQTLGAYLSKDSARTSFREWVSRATSQVLETPITALTGGEREASRDEGQGLEPGLALELLEGFLQSDRFATVVRTALETVLVTLEGASLASIAGEGDAAAAIARAIVHVGGKAPDAAAVEATVRAVRVLAAPAGAGLSRWLSRSALRPEIERGARDILHTALEKLSPFQRILVRAGKYDRRLEEKLPEIVDEAVARLGDFLADQGTKESLGEAVRSALLPDAAAAGSADAGAADPPATGAEVRDALVDVIAAWVRPLLGRPLVSSVGDVSGLGPAELAERLADRIARHARLPGTAATILEALRNAAKREGGEGTVGQLLGLGPVVKTRLDTLLADKALELLRARLVDLLAGLDIRSMVVQRIDSLDVQDVEKLLMMVIARHLKWINVFGAILGCFIGLVQAVLSNLT